MRFMNIFTALGVLFGIASNCFGAKIVATGNTPVIPEEFQGTPISIIGNFNYQCTQESGGAWMLIQLLVSEKKVDGTSRTVYRLAYHDEAQMRFNNTAPINVYLPDAGASYSFSIQNTDGGGGWSSTSAGSVNSVYVIAWDAPGNDVVELQTQFTAELETLKKEYDQKMADMKAELEAADAALKAELEQKIKDVAEMYEERMTKLEKMLQAINDALRKRMDSLERRLYYSLLNQTDLDKALLEQQTKVDEKAAAIDALDTLIKEKQARGEDTTSDEALLQSYKNEIVDLACVLSDIKYAVDGRPNSEFAALHEAIKNLQSQLELVQKNLQNEIAALKEELTLYIDAGDGKLSERMQEIYDELLALIKDQQKGLLALQQQLDGQLESLRSLANNTGRYGSGLSSSGYGLPSTSRAEAPTDDRDLRTSDSTSLRW